MVVASPGAGKTNYSCEEILSLGIGPSHPFMGKFAVTRSYRVGLYERDCEDWDLEDFMGALVRQYLISTRGDYPREDGRTVWPADLLENIIIYPDEPIDIANLNDACRLTRTILDEKLDFFYLDSFRAAHSMDENSSKEMKAVTENLRAIQQMTGCHLRLIHHDNKAQGKGISRIRGTTGIPAAVNSVTAIDGQKNSPEDFELPRLSKPIRGRTFNGKPFEWRLTKRTDEHGYTLATVEYLGKSDARERSNGDKGTYDQFIVYWESRGARLTRKEGLAWGLINGHGEKSIDEFFKRTRAGGAQKNTEGKEAVFYLTDGLPKSGGACYRRPERIVPGTTHLYVPGLGWSRLVGRPKPLRKK